MSFGMDKENQQPIASRFPESYPSQVYHASRPQSSVCPKPVYHPAISIAPQPYPLYASQVINTDPHVHNPHHLGSSFGHQGHQFPSGVFPSDVPGYYGARGENLPHPVPGVLKPIVQNVPVSSQDRILVPAPPPMVYGSEGQHNTIPFPIKTEASPTATSQPRSNQSSLSPTENLWLPTTSSEPDSRPCSRASTVTGGGGITKRSSKQVVEKLRRERINSSVNELKSLLLKDKTASNFATAKLEKADVLEMAVSRIRELEHKNRPDSLILDENSRVSTLSDAVEMKDSVTRYAAGFAQCTQEVLSFLEMCDGRNLDPSVKLKLFNHLQSCNRTLESATKKDTVMGPGSESVFSVSHSRQQFMPAHNDVKRSPFASVNINNQCSPLLQQQQRSSSMFGSQLKTPPRVPLSPATPVSMKTNNPTTPQHFLRPHLFRQPQFTKPDLSPYNGSPIQSATLSNFKDTCPVVLGTVATPPTPKQSMTTSVTRLGTVTSSRNAKFAICCTPSPPPPRKSLGKIERTPLARSSLARTSNFVESNDEEEDEEEAGFEPMFTATVAATNEDVTADDEVGGPSEGSCWRPW